MDKAHFSAHAALMFGTRLVGASAVILPLTLLEGCGRDDQPQRAAASRSVSYETLDACVRAGRISAVVCRQAYDDAKNDHAVATPAYGTQEECQANSPENQPCEFVYDPSGSIYDGGDSYYQAPMQAFWVTDDTAGARSYYNPRPGRKIPVGNILGRGFKLAKRLLPSSAPADNVMPSAGIPANPLKTPDANMRATPLTSVPSVGTGIVRRILPTAPPAYRAQSAPSRPFASMSTRFKMSFPSRRR